MSRSVFAMGAALAVCGLMVAAAPATARTHKHAHAVRALPVTTPRAAPTPTPYSFYPNNIEGGVPGNLPFNNQLRKLSDPLNANGAGN